MTANAGHSQRVVRDLKRVVRDSEELLQDSREALGEKALHVRERLSQTLRQARQTCSRLQEKTRAAGKATDQAIRDHPYQSIGIAMGIGALAGFLVARRRK